MVIKRIKQVVELVLLIFLAPVFLSLVLTIFYILIPPLSMPIVGSFLSGQETHWRWRSYDEISPHLKRAVIAAEDGRFCEHNGVDWIAVEKVANKAARKGRLSRGASTIPMQTAKNLFLWPLPDLLRKPLEIPLATWMDAMWSKRRMLEIYLNIAQFGNGIYGAEAASRFYFKKSASQLNINEASALAAILPNPEKRNPERLTSKIANYAITIKARSGSSRTSCLK